MFTLYQFTLSTEARQHASLAGNIEDKLRRFPEIAIQRDVMFHGGTEGYESWMSKYYTSVDQFDVRDLNQVFAKGQEPTSGVERRSVSIGDIIFDESAGEAWMVDFNGFNLINVFGLINQFDTEAA